MSFITITNWQLFTALNWLLCLEAWSWCPFSPYVHAQCTCIDILPDRISIHVHMTYNIWYPKYEIPEWRKVYMICNSYIFIEDALNFHMSFVICFIHSFNDFILGLCTCIGIHYRITYHGLSSMHMSEFYILNFH